MFPCYTWNLYKYHFFFCDCTQSQVFCAHVNHMQQSHKAAAAFVNIFGVKLFICCNLSALGYIREHSIILLMWYNVTLPQTGLHWCCSGLTFPNHSAGAMSVNVKSPPIMGKLLVS